MVEELLLVLGGAFVLSLVMMTSIHYVAKYSKPTKEDAPPYEFKWKKFAILTLTSTIVFFAMYMIAIHIGLFGIIVLIGAPGALISFLRKGKM